MRSLYTQEAIKNRGYATIFIGTQGGTRTRTTAMVKGV